MTALVLRSVSAGYGSNRVVFNVSTALEPGGWLAIIGPNGAGKSTLLKSIVGLADSDGEILLHGRPAVGLGARERARAIGYAPQIPVLPDRLTVTDYALLGRTPHLGLLAKEGRRDLMIVEQVLARLDLSDLAGRLLRTLSGGERQRAVLARVLAQQAGLLLLDEPTTGLDIGHAQALLDLVDRLRAEDGATVVSTLHDLTFAAQYADHLLLLDGGEVVAAGAPAEVLTRDAVRRHFDAEVEVLSTARGQLVVAPARLPGGPV
ncbi:MAG TPA: ABC transporter ATP-binding protein [Actinophytocola sp.]|uniref:ABC transporter ATP-binding protein n=1 Tax=Actinophytocola sp. TaxID=1872138 RepID=UPI002DDD002F|nr:ABC transporter ATP-binding protein [Actinophytocola sp.]HEV2784021.1 ABC transporter ATP-binding protein [Actinophytocola sp.]